MLNLVLLFVNYNIYQNKNEGYVYRLETYNNLYYPSPLLYIKGFENIYSDSITLDLSSVYNNKTWQVEQDDAIHYNSGTELKIYFPQRDKNYESKFSIHSSDNEQSFSLHAQRQSDGDIHIIRSSIPVMSDQKYSFDDFCNIDWMDKAEKDSVNMVLKKILLIDTCSNTLSKVRTICQFLCNSVKDHPGASLVYNWPEYTPWFLYCKGSVGESTLECNEYSEVYNLFANVAGVKTRRIGITGMADSDGFVKFSGHHFNESYIDEQQNWAFVDLTSDKSYIVNDSGKVLNTFELFIANLSGEYSNLKVVSTLYDSTTVQNYSSVRSSEDLYFNKDAIIQYKYGVDRFGLYEQVKRYLTDPEPALSLNYSNQKRRIKNLFLALNGIVGVLFFFVMSRLIVRLRNG